MTSVSISLQDRLMMNIVVSPETACWLWTGCGDKKGYGRTSVRDKPGLAHRISYEVFVGVIPENLEIDHLCSNRRCINPNHLEPVSRQENIRRSEAGSFNRKKTHCPKGHPYSTDNLRTQKIGLYTGRFCRACRKETVRRYDRKRYSLSKSK